MGKIVLPSSKFPETKTCYSLYRFPASPPPISAEQRKKPRTLCNFGTSVIRKTKLTEDYKLIKIRKSTQKQVVAAIKSGDFSTVDKIKELAEKDARKVFDAVVSGSVPLIWYDLPPVRCQSGAASFLRYALHRSTKKADHLQLSCMEIKNGRMIPTSDRQYNVTDGGFSEFFRDLPGVANIKYLEQ